MLQARTVRTLRLLTVLAVLLTLPGYGMAGLSSLRSCQAQISDSRQVSMPGDCCPGHGEQGVPCKGLGSPLKGQKAPCTPCKAGFNCKSPQSFEPVSLAVVIDRPATSSRSADPPALVLSHSPDGLWRPPRFI